MDSFSLDKYINQKQFEFNGISKEFKKSLDNITNEILNFQMNNSVYVVDKIEEGMFVCENLQTRDIIQLSADVIPNGIKEGDCLIKENDKFVYSEKITKDRERNIEEKFNRLLEF